MVDVRQGGFVSVRARLAVCVASLLALLAMGAISAGGAQAYENVEPGFESFEVVPTTSQAGGHPDVSIDYIFRIDETFGEDTCTSECLYGRRSIVHWPEGFIGNPHVAPKCTLTEFSIASCPSDSQIGFFNLKGLAGEGIFVPLYNMQTNPEQAGLLGFTAPLIAFPMFIELSGRTESDYGLEAASTPQVRLPFNHFQLVLWGVPAGIPVRHPDSRRRLLWHRAHSRGRRLSARHTLRKRNVRSGDDSSGAVPAESDDLRSTA